MTDGPPIGRVWFTRSPVYLSICPSLCLCVSRLQPAYPHAPVHLSCLCCLAYCAQADCLAWSPVCLPDETNLPFPRPYCLLLSHHLLLHYVGVVLRPSHRQSKVKQKQTRGVGSAVVGGYVVWFCPTGTIPQTEETRLRQPRAGLTNQPTSDPTDTPKNWPICSPQPIPTGPACQNLGFLRS